MISGRFLRNILYKFYKQKIRAQLRRVERTTRN